MYVCDPSVCIFSAVIEVVQTLFLWHFAGLQDTP